MDTGYGSGSASMLQTDGDGRIRMDPVFGGGLAVLHLSAVSRSVLQILSLTRLGSEVGRLPRGNRKASMIPPYYAGLGRTYCCATSPRRPVWAGSQSSPQVDHLLTAAKGTDG